MPVRGSPAAAGGDSSGVSAVAARRAAGLGRRGGFAPPSAPRAAARVALLSRDAESHPNVARHGEEAVEVEDSCPLGRRHVRRLGPQARPVLCLGERGGFRKRYGRHPVAGLDSRGEERGEAVPASLAQPARFGPEHLFGDTVSYVNHFTFSRSAVSLAVIRLGGGVGESSAANEVGSFKPFYLLLAPCGCQTLLPQSSCCSDTGWQGVCGGGVCVELSPQQWLKENKKLGTEFYFLIENLKLR